MGEHRNKLGQWMADFRWAMNMLSVRRARRRMGFSRRLAFDDALRPRIGGSQWHTDAGVINRQDVIAYPDALYFVTADDVIRAMGKAAEVRTP